MNVYKCTWCGRFIADKDLEEGKATYEFIPDTEFTQEQTILTCKKCKEKD